MKRLVEIQFAGIKQYYNKIIDTIILSEGIIKYGHK